MKKKIALIVLFVLIFVGCMLGVWWFIVYHNFGMLFMHMILFALLAYSAPVIWLNSELRLPAYTWEIIIGFMAFFWSYLKDFYVNPVFPSGIDGIFFFDGLELMIVGFCFAIICIVEDNRKIMNDLTKL